MTGTFQGVRGSLIPAIVMVSAGVAVLSVYNPIYVAVLLGAGIFLAVLLLDPAAGLALFTLLTFFGELGHGASPIKAAGALLVVFWLLRLGRRDFVGAPFLGWTRPQIFYLSLAVVAWSGFSLLWATDPGTARSTALRLALNVTLFIVVPSLASTRRDLFLVLYAYVFGAALTALYGIASGNANTDAAGRLAGGIGDPNELAALLVPGIILGFVLMSFTPSLIGRVALSASIAVEGFALVFSQSRGGVIALGAAALAGVVWGGRQRGKFLFAVLGIVSVVATYAALTSLSFGRFSSFGGGGTGRVDIWAVALRVFRAHPILGVGIGNFPVVEGQYAAANLNITRIDLVLDMHKVTHNTYLNVLADLGLVGLALFVGLIVLVLRAVVRRIRVALKENDVELESLGRGILIALVGLLVAFTFISAQYEKQLWLLLGLALAAANLRSSIEEVDEPDAHTPPSRPPVVRAVARPPDRRPSYGR